MILISDTRQQKGKHTQKERYWEKNGIEVIYAPLPCGDYILGNEKAMDVIRRKEKRGMKPEKADFLGTFKVAVDTKKDIQELVGNVCGKQHDRFRDECILAQNNGVKLYVLVQNVGGLIKGTRDIYNPTIRDLEELHKWRNPRLFATKPTDEVFMVTKTGRPIYKRVQKYPTATKGISLMKACMTMQKKYGIEFVFCHDSEQGAKVLELLQREAM